MMSSTVLRILTISLFATSVTGFPPVATPEATTTAKPTTTTTALCPDGYTENPASNTCFRFVPKKVDWFTAKADCESVGDSLPTFDNQEASEWFRLQQINHGWRILDGMGLGGGGHTWIGGHKVGGEFRWEGLIKGPLALKRYAPGEPNNDGNNRGLCLLTWGSSQLWGDNPCEKQYAYACERRKALCPDGYTENPASNTCFRFVPKKVDWFTAKADCESVGDSLPTFDEQEASEWFRLQQINHGWRILDGMGLGGGGHTWIGGHKVGGEFRWEGLIQGPLTLKRYAPGEPNNDGNNRGLCLLTWGSSQLWGDNPCEKQYAYACERRKALCPDGYTENPASNTCFRFVPKKVDWFTAKADCESVGDSLPTFDDQEASEWFRLQQINHSWRILDGMGSGGGGHTWIGGHKVGGEFRWEGLIQGPLTLKRYAPGEPNNDGNNRGLCLLTWGSSQLWGDNPCEKQYAYACERRKALCPDGYTENPASNTCFRFVPKKVDWFTAKADCESVGDSLPTFDDHEASEWFRLQQINHGWRILDGMGLGGGGHTWIGGHKVGGEFRWEGLIEGPLTLKRYTPGEPNNDGNHQGLCLLTWSSSQLWGDNPCEKQYAYACERRKGE